MTPGNLVYVKTTGEQVMVASHPDSAPRPATGNLSGVYVLVVRPIAGQDGIRHEAEYFPIELLETAEDRFNREYEEHFELQSKVRVKKAQKELNEVGVAAEKFPTETLN